MASEGDEKVIGLIRQQQAMNRVTFERLSELGLTPSTRLRLDFCFLAMDEAAARTLVALLERETDYEVKLSSPREDRRDWCVEGSTQETSVSLAVLDDWVDWMVRAGVQSGCELDGWGTDSGLWQVG